MIKDRASSPAKKNSRIVYELALSCIYIHDWYNFTDKQGNKWLVEGLREDIVKPAVYHDGL